MNEVEYWLWLSQRPGCGVVTQQKLLAEFGSALEVWKADAAVLRRIPGLNSEQMDSLRQKDLGFARTILADCQRLGITVITWDDDRYPERLRQIYDPPTVLYLRGTLPDFDHRACIAVVGTRKCSRYGTDATSWIAEDLARRGCIVVSGMALGIDGAANAAALRVGAQTVVVLGCGVDVCYPWQHKKLMQGIIKNGAVISEYPPGTEPKGQNFPARNRIITGLCQGTLVVEAPKKSGALISAQLALEQGRDVFAVPGNINSTLSAGVNQLIRRGEAELVTSAAQIAEHYAGLLAQPQIVPPGEKKKRRTVRRRRREEPEPKKKEQTKEPTPRPFVPLNDVETRVVQALEQGADRMDAVIERTGLSTAAATAAVTMLEIKGIITRDGSTLRMQPEE